MSIVSTTVIVPATTANLGPGFDCIGAALTLYNQFKFSRLDASAEIPLTITATGTEAHLVTTDDSNLVYQAFVKLYEHINVAPPAVKIEIELGVPLARGLGSSATAIVGGLVGANKLAGEPLTQTEVMQMAIAIEGHPDNVVPALLGGCRLAATSLTQEEPPQTPPNQGRGNNWEICDIPWHPNIVPVVAIPNFELSTKQARGVLPKDYSRADAIFNIAHLGLLLRGLETGRAEWLRAALQDKIHQPYRKTLIPGYDVVQTAALEAGAYGMVISGAGPTLLALIDTSQALAVETAMTTAWQEQGITAEVRSLSIDTQGARSFTDT
ncbi:MAG: homoserine kinase [Potamolinea sp.]